MRKLSKSEFKAYRCGYCIACNPNKKRPECMYDECPFFGTYTGLINYNGKKRRSRIINEFKPEPVIVAKAPRPRKVDVDYIRSLAERGEYAIDIANKLNLRPQVVGDIIKGGGELVL